MHLLTNLKTKTKQTHKFLEMAWL